MLKKFADFVLKLSGWTVDVTLPAEKKFVIIGAPHTSNWDLIITLLCIWSVQKKIHWVAKDQIFIGPFNYIFRRLGGIPVDRASANGFIRQIADRYKQQDELIIALTPEGTRAKTDHWKTGFYYIAKAANVPICLGFADYSSRTFGFGKMLYPGEDIEKDFEIIAAFYQDKKGLYPENQGPVRIRQK